MAIIIKYIWGESVILIPGDYSESFLALIGLINIDHTLSDYCIYKQEPIKQIVANNHVSVC